MEGIRGSVSRFKKKFKRRLAGSKHEPRGTGSGPHTETVDSANPEPLVAAGVRHDLEGTPQPDESQSVPARENEDDQEGRESDDDGSQRPVVEVAVGSGRGRDGSNASGQKVERAHLSPSTASTQYTEKPGST